MNTDKTLLEKESQPSCLGAVRRSRIDFAEWILKEGFEK
jgi:hypothetical protein